MLKLYYSPGSCSLASHIVLEETGLPFEKHRVDFDGGEGDTPEFRRLSPLGVVPVLILENGEALTEGAAILQYLADRKPDLKLAPPAAAAERYRLQEALNFVATEIHKGYSPLFIARNLEEPTAQEAIRAQALKNLSLRFDVLESRLAKQDYLLPSGYSVADAYLFVVMNWSTFLKVDVSKWPNLAAHSQRVRNRPAVQRALKTESLA